MSRRVGFIDVTMVSCLNYLLNDLFTFDDEFHNLLGSYVVLVPVKMEKRNDVL